jgi:hypothetical protein
MRTVNSHPIFTVISAILVVVSIGGCARRAEVLADGSLASPSTVLATAASETAPLGSPSNAPVMTVEPATTDEPAATVEPAPATTPGPTPVPTPDLASIEALLSGIDGDLGDDASAATYEGSPQ